MRMQSLRRTFHFSSFFLDINSLALFSSFVNMLFEICAEMSQKTVLNAHLLANKHRIVREKYRIDKGY